MRDALGERGVEVVQGAVHAEPDGRDGMGPWDHTKWITTPTPFFETCNVGYSRAAVERVGGFDEDDPLLHPLDGRAFGEDACLAWDVQATGGEARFVGRAVASVTGRVGSRLAADGANKPVGHPSAGVPGCRYPGGRAAFSQLDRSAQPRFQGYRHRRSPADRAPLGRKQRRQYASLAPAPDAFQSRRLRALTPDDRRHQ